MKTSPIEPSSEPQTGFSRSQRIQLFLISNLGWTLIRLVSPTFRYRIIGKNQFKLGPRPAIYTFWHNQIVGAVYQYRNEGIVVLTSRHFDGEYIARIIRRFGYGAARGSSTRGAVRSLLELRELLKNGTDIAFTIDGPKGPRYRVKPGPVFLSQKTGFPIVPFHVEPKRYWELNSWDRLRIPKPFTPILIKFSTPLYIAPEDNPKDSMKVLQSRMDELGQEMGRFIRFKTNS